MQPAVSRTIRGRVCSDIIYGTVKPNYSSALSRNAVRYTRKVESVSTNKMIVR